MDFTNNNNNYYNNNNLFNLLLRSLQDRESA